MMCRLFLVPLLGLAACAPSPLYVSSQSVKHGAVAEVPRDGQGEPIWSAVHPPLPSSISPGPVVVPLYAGTAVAASTPRPPEVQAPIVQAAPLTKEEKRACKHQRRCN